RRVGSGMITKTAVPESRPDGSATPTTTRSNSEAGARLRQPTQVRTGDAPLTTEKVYPAVLAISGSGFSAVGPGGEWWRSARRRPVPGGRPVPGRCFVPGGRILRAGDDLHRRRRFLRDDLV